MQIPAKNYSEGFSQVELCACLATLLLLALVSPAAFGRNKGTSRSVECLNNQQQLIRAWSLYADDNQGKLVENYHGGDAMGGNAGLDPRKAPWATGWLTWGTEKDNTNVSLIADPKYARLANYTGGKSHILKCPEDNYLSAAQKRMGWKARVRSVVMNGTVGGGNATTGPWDATIYKQALAFGDFIYPTPAETFVFIEEHPDSMNDPFIFPPRSNQLVDVPAGFHKNGASLSYADGSVSLKKWQGVSARRLPTTTALFIAPSGDQADVRWLSFHSQRKSSKSY